MKGRKKERKETKEEKKNAIKKENPINGFKK